MACDSDTGIGGRRATERREQAPGQRNREASEMRPQLTVLLLTPNWLALVEIGGSAASCGAN